MTNLISTASDTTAKQQISSYTQAYKETFKNEYIAFLNMQKVKVKIATDDNKHALLHGTTIGEMRQWGEMPETLFSLLQDKLTAVEWKWFQSTTGQRWFFNTFPEFKVAGGKL